MKPDSVKPDTAKPDSARLDSAKAELEDQKKSQRRIYSTLPALFFRHKINVMKKLTSI